LTNFVEIEKARDKILSLKLDQVHSTFQLCYIQLISTHRLDIRHQKVTQSCLELVCRPLASWAIDSEVRQLQ